MLPDRVSNPGPLTYESGTLPIVLRGPAVFGIVSEGKNLHLVIKEIWYVSCYYKVDNVCHDHMIITVK